MNSLYYFTARASDDPVKRDLELACDDCGAIVCDIEDGDSLGLLADMAGEHEHARDMRSSSSVPRFSDGSPAPVDFILRDEDFLRGPNETDEG